MIGQTLGHYEIIEKLGEGGMGVVYLARDTGLSRTVAIKILPAHATSDPERKRRFVQEAKAASALNHPNIVTIYEIGSDRGVDFIAMEYLKGHTLAELLSRKPLTVKQAIEYAMAVAEALAAAHAGGIVHRDLKPANIMITDEGRVKVLDFGLAKLTETTTSDEFAATQTLAAVTEEGTILGTVQYMSPEQAEGGKIDHRSDIFSFGAVLYEMLAGRRAFHGAKRISILADILHKEPAPIAEIVEGVPRELEKIIARCLRKDPRRRFQVMDDVRLALEDSADETEKAPPVAQASPGSRRILAIATAALFGAVGLGVGWWIKPQASSGQDRVLRKLTSESGLTTDPTVSADGKLLAYASDRAGKGNLDIWVQQLAGGEALQITSDDADERDPSFSPDGSKIVFRSERDGGGIYVVSSLGGEPRRIADHGRRPRFSPDGKQIAFWSGSDLAQVVHVPGSAKIYTMPANGGTPRQIEERFAIARWPVWSPDGKRLLFFGILSNDDTSETRSDWWLANLDGSPATRTGARLDFARYGLSAWPEAFYVPASYTPDGVLFSARKGDSTNVWRIAISPRTGRSTGNLRRVTGGTGQEAYASMAPGGALVFATIGDNIDLWSLPMDSNGGKQTGEMQRLTQDSAPDFYPSIDTGGKLMAFISSRSGRDNVWLKDLQTGRETPVTVNQSSFSLTLVSGDGSEIVYQLNENRHTPAYRVQIGRSPTGGMRTGIPQKFCSECSAIWDWASDKRFAIFSKGNDSQMWRLNPASGEKTPFLNRPNTVLGRARISPDTRWVAFILRSGARAQLWIVPLRDGAQPLDNEWVAVTNGERQDAFPHWSPDGNLLYFESDRDGTLCLWAQRLDPETKRPLGSAFAVHHFHDVRRSLANIPIPAFGLAVTRDRIVLALGERTGNIWIAEPAERH